MMMRFFWGILCLAWATTTCADYRETMDPDGPIKNLKTDYGLVDDNARRNQREIVQEAINDVSEQGGGRILMPKGVYRFSDVYLKSNVHLLIEKGTVIKPFWPEGKKVVVFILDVAGKRQSAASSDQRNIENVSIRGLDGKFIVDYSDRGSVPGEGVRVANCRQVRNFLLSDISVYDSFTTYCAFVFTPAKDADAREREVFRPTDGLVRNLESTNSSPGYGLVQMHAGDRIHFENLSASGGGITFRLETGAGGHNGGVHNITAKNIYCENGATAVCLGPHKAQNGVVKIDGVRTKSCAFAVTMGPGFVEKRNQHDKRYKSGIFGAGTTVKNIHAIFGTDAAVSLKELANVPKAYLPQLRVDPNDRVQKRVRGPSVGVVRDSTGNSWTPMIENVSSEGFKYNLGILSVDKHAQSRNWRAQLAGLPILEQLEGKVGLKEPWNKRSKQPKHEQESPPQ